MNRLLPLSVVLLAILTAGRVSADVRSLHLHIRLNCPYGLAG